MKRFLLLSAAVVAMALAFVAPSATAADSDIGDPIAVVVVRSLDELAANAAAIGELIEEPKLQLGVTAAKALIGDEGVIRGLDTSRPLGAVVMLKDGKPAGFGVIPVKDMDALEESTELFIESTEETKPGVYHLVPADEKGEPSYVKPMGDWLLISDRDDVFPPEIHDATEKIALALLDGADAMVHVQLANVPQKAKDELLAKIAKESARDLEKKQSGNAAIDGLQADLRDAILEIAETVVNDLESVAIGVKFDQEATAVEATVRVKAATGSLLAEYLDDDAARPTLFSAWRSPLASAHLAINTTCPIGPMVEWGPAVDEVKKMAFAGIAEKHEDPAEQEVLKTFVNDVLDVIEQTVASDVRDGAIAVVAKPDAKAIVCGGYSTDGYAIEDAFGALIEAARAEHGDKIDAVLEEDVAEIEGVHLHKLTLPIPEDAKDREKVVALVGEKLTVIAGFGENAVYLAAGPQAPEAMHYALTESSADPQCSPRCSFALSVEDLAAFLAKYGDTEKKREHAKKALSVLTQYPGECDVTVAVAPIAGGREATLTIEEGILRTIAAAIKAKNAK